MPSPQELPRTKEQPKLAGPEHDIDSDPQNPAIFSAASRRRIQVCLPQEPDLLLAISALMRVTSFTRASDVEQNKTLKQIVYQLCTHLGTQEFLKQS